MGPWTPSPPPTPSRSPRPPRPSSVSERTVWRYLKSGRLPGETVGEPGSQRTLIPSEAVDALRGNRVGGDAEALRAERDRLIAELAVLRAERDVLHGRVTTLQRALVAPARPGLAERALSRALEVAARARGPRVTAVR